MAKSSDALKASLKNTALNALHKQLGARMVSFAGYQMPVQYKTGIINEHNHVRQYAGLFDGSHMGQAMIRGDNPALAFERLVSNNITDLGQDRLRYSLLMNESGGILDDLIITRRSTSSGREEINIVVNANRKDDNFKYIEESLHGLATLEPADDLALIALQGPKSAAVLMRFDPTVTNLIFMSSSEIQINGINCFVSRSGYTGEDGFEISLPSSEVENLTLRLLEEPEVELVGLGARDSLRLEAGLCLYGHDIDINTSPIEAELGWAVDKKRCELNSFPGAKLIFKQITDGVNRRRVGLLPDGPIPLREGTLIIDKVGKEIGYVTSGGYSPTLKRPIAMGYLAVNHSNLGSNIWAYLRGNKLRLTVVSLPFVKHQYYRGT